MKQRKYSFSFMQICIPLGVFKPIYNTSEPPIFHWHLPAGNGNLSKNVRQKQIRSVSKGSSVGDKHASLGYVAPSCVKGSCGLSLAFKSELKKQITLGGIFLKSIWLWPVTVIILDECFWELPPSFPVNPFAPNSCTKKNKQASCWRTACQSNSCIGSV